jgi:TetR/AcrR family transcriptional regulator, cholesterol catabolism regulator
MATVRALPSAVDPRRVEICRTAAQVFRDRGYDATSVSDVARALGLTKAGLYHYFDSKEALLFEIMAYGLERVRDEVVLPVRGIQDPEERLQQIVLRHARIATQGKGAVSLLGDEIRALPPVARKQIEEKMRIYIDLVRDTLDELKTAGRLHDVDTTVAAFSLIGMILWLPRWFRQNGRLSQERAAVELSKLAMAGLVRPRAPRAPKGRRSLDSKILKSSNPKILRSSNSA